MSNHFNKPTFSWEGKTELDDETGIATFTLNTTETVINLNSFKDAITLDKLLGKAFHHGEVSASSEAAGKK